MTASILSLLQPLKDRLTAATPGPWYLRECPPCTERGRLDVKVWDATGNVLIADWCDDDEYGEPDAQLIASAPTDQAKLIAAIEAVEDWCKNLDAMEQIDPSSADHRNVSAGGVARTIRAVLTQALVDG